MTSLIVFSENRPELWSMSGLKTKIVNLKNEYELLVFHSLLGSGMMAATFSVLAMMRSPEIGIFRKNQERLNWDSRSSSLWRIEFNRKRRSFDGPKKSQRIFRHPQATNPLLDAPNATDCSNYAFRLYVPSRFQPKSHVFKANTSQARQNVAIGKISSADIGFLEHQRSFVVFGAFDLHELLQHRQNMFVQFSAWISSGNVACISYTCCRINKRNTTACWNPNKLNKTK